MSSHKRHSSFMTPYQRYKKENEKRRRSSCANVDRAPTLPPLYEYNSVEKEKENIVLMKRIRVKDWKRQLKKINTIIQFFQSEIKNIQKRKNQNETVVEELLIWKSIFFKKINYLYQSVLKHKNDLLQHHFLGINSYLLLSIPKPVHFPLSKCYKRGDTSKKKSIDLGCIHFSQKRNVFHLENDSREKETRRLFKILRNMSRQLDIQYQMLSNILPCLLNLKLILKYLFLMEIQLNEMEKVLIDTRTLLRKKEFVPVIRNCTRNHRSRTAQKQRNHRMVTTCKVNESKLYLVAHKKKLLSSCFRKSTPPTIPLLSHQISEFRNKISLPRKKHTLHIIIKGANGLKKEELNMNRVPSKSDIEKGKKFRCSTSPFQTRKCRVSSGRKNNPLSKSADSAIRSLTSERKTVPIPHRSVKSAKPSPKYSRSARSTAKSSSRSTTHFRLRNGRKYRGEWGRKGNNNKKKKGKKKRRRKAATYKLGKKKGRGRKTKLRRGGGVLERGEFQAWKIPKEKKEGEFDIPLIRFDE